MKKLSLFLAVALLVGSNAFAAQIETKFIADGAVTAVKMGSGACVTNIGAGVYDAAGAATGIIASSISDADTTHCADGNSVFDALAGKSSTSHDHSGVYDPAGTAAGYIEDSVTNGVTNKVPTENAVYDAIAAIPSQKTYFQETLTLGAGDITAQYIDMAQDCQAASVQLDVSGVKGHLTADYTLSSVSSKTRITFVATTGWGTGSPQALIAGDKIYAYCAY